MARVVAVISVPAAGSAVPGVHRARRSPARAAAHRLHSFAGRAGRYCRVHSSEIAGLAVVLSVAAITLSGVAEASTDIYAPLPGPADMHRILDPVRQGPQGPGIDMGHVALWQLARTYLMPLWLAWSIYSSHGWTF